MNNEGCPRHALQLTKTVKPATGETIFVCPKLKCGYKENENGEMI